MLASLFSENPALSSTMIIAKKQCKSIDWFVYDCNFGVYWVKNHWQNWKRLTLSGLRNSCNNLIRISFKSCFIILLKVLRLNPSPLRLQLTFLALFYTYKITTSIVSSVLTFLLVPSLLFCFFVVVVLRFSILFCFLVGLSLEIFCSKPPTGFVMHFNYETRCSVVNCTSNTEVLFFISLFKVGIKFSKKLPYHSESSIISPKKVSGKKW